MVNEETAIFVRYWLHQARRAASLAEKARRLKRRAWQNGVEAPAAVRQAVYDADNAVSSAIVVAEETLAGRLKAAARAATIFNRFLRDAQEAMKKN